MSRTILADVAGFTPLIDCLTNELGHHGSAVFGRVWRYCQMESGVCQASLETIGDGLGLSRPTVIAWLDRLCELGYLEDLTPDVRNRPHIYRDTGKVGLRAAISGGSQIDCGVKKDTTEESKRDTPRSQKEVLEDSSLRKIFKRGVKRGEDRPAKYAPGELADFMGD